jgi:hypothetical protein
MFRPYLAIKQKTETIKNILRNNEYDIKAINKLPPLKKGNKLTHMTKKQSGQHLHIVAEK